MIKPAHLVALFLVLFLLITVPLTVIVSLQSGQTSTKSQAATTVSNPLSELINTRGDHLAAHQITLADPMDCCYSWGKHSTEGAKTASGGSVNAWLVVERDVSQLGTTFNAKVAIKNMRMYVHLPGQGWVQTMNGMPSWNVTSNIETNGNYTDIGHSVESDGSWSFSFPPNLALHFSQNSPGYVLPSTEDGVAVVVEARVIGPDSALTKWGLNGGADHKATDGSCSSSICDALGVGRFGLLTSEYKSYVMLTSALTDAQVQADPPPTFTTGTPVDNPPTVSITSPPNGATITTTSQTITATASDDNGVSKVDFYVDGALKGTDTTSPYSYNWNTSGLSGSHTIYAKATDTASQVTQSATITVTVNLGGGGAPTYLWCEAESGTLVSPMVKGSDANASSSNYVYSTITDSTNVPPAGTGSVTLNISIPTAGTYTFWTRMNYGGEFQNSYYAQFDGGTLYKVGNENSGYNAWKWVDWQNGDTGTTNLITVNLTAGNHTLRLIGREANTLIDKILLTSDTTYVPSGTGSPANCSGGSVPPTLGDINGDGLVNISDLSDLLSNWNTTNAAADLNSDGIVDVSDLSILLSNWT